MFYPQKESRSTKFLVSIAGPLTNFLLAIIIWFLPEFTLKETMIYANLLVGVFNLLPIYPMDGGRMLEALLKKFYPGEQIENIINKTSNGTMILLTILASIGILYVKNIAIFFAIVYLWWIRIADNRRYRIKNRVRKILKQKGEKVVLE